MKQTNFAIQGQPNLSKIGFKRPKSYLHQFFPDVSWMGCRYGVRWITWKFFLTFHVWVVAMAYVGLHGIFIVFFCKVVLDDFSGLSSGVAHDSDPGGGDCFSDFFLVVRA